MSEQEEAAAEEKILELAKEKANGITNKDIQAAIPDTPATIWTSVINKLLKNR